MIDLLIAAQEYILDAVSCLKDCPRSAKLDGTIAALTYIAGTNEPPANSSIEAMIRIIEDALRD